MSFKMAPKLKVTFAGIARKPPRQSSRQSLALFRGEMPK